MKKAKIIATVKEYGSLILVAFIITSSIVQGSLVPTGSMERTIRVGDFILVNRLAYDFYSPRNLPHTSIRLPNFNFNLFGDPERGDIVVFEWPGDRDAIEPFALQSWVKRCVGLPGDTVEIRNRVLYVNGKEYPKPEKINYELLKSRPYNYSDPNIYPKNSGWNSDYYGPIVIPKQGEVVDLNLENIYKFETMINREYGRRVVNIKNGKIYIDGTPADKYEIKTDYYFMLGDNRDNSLDSRFWGFVPRERVLGNPMFVFLSFDTEYLSFSKIFKLLASIRIDRIGKIL